MPIRGVFDQPDGSGWWIDGMDSAGIWTRWL